MSGIEPVSASSEAIRQPIILSPSDSIICFSFMSQLAMLTQCLLLGLHSEITPGGTYDIGDETKVSCVQGK